MGRQGTTGAIAPICLRYFPFHLHSTGAAGANAMAVDPLGIAVVECNPVLHEHLPQICAAIAFKLMSLDKNLWHDGSPRIVKPVDDE
jgi:hypothetical protein